MIVYRDLTTARDCEAVFALEQAVWQMPADGAVPPHMLRALVHGGGHMAGAWDDKVLAGFTLAFPAKKGDEWILWSHMTGVHPAYQGQGIGFHLKQHQRTWAIENGYEIISWTFDPLQQRNAYFNLHRLGATSNTYHRNFYGELRDSINEGLQTDRLEIAWHLNKLHLQDLSEGQTRKSLMVDDETPRLISNDNGSLHITLPRKWGAKHYIVEIPHDLNMLRVSAMTQVIQWQNALAEVFTTAFAQGYKVTDFWRFEERCGYILT